MKDSIKVYQYNAFTTLPKGGNPAGVVLNAENLSEKQMQEIAYKIGFNETVFVMKSLKGDFRIRYFTPGHEINLCGHGTVASISALKSKGIIGERENITIETKAGVLKIKLFEKDKRWHILMEQASPSFIPFNGSIEELAYSIGVNIEDIDESIPIVYGSTGTWTLLVPIKTLEAFSRMKPQNKLFPNILSEMPHCSVHPFCMETTKKYAHMHGRHFSSPFSGTVEDPVTGTASGVMGAYYITYISPFEKSLELIVEQGEEIKSEGCVHVYVEKEEDDIRVAISGTAVYVESFITVLDIDTK